MEKINKVMIPNRGEIACRILATLNRMGIDGVLALHPLDGDSPAAALAPEIVWLDGEPPVSAYLDTEQIIAACKETGADALHPGFGFLAENPAFARRLAEEGITFIGPLPDTMEIMGDKVAARSFCLEHGFPLAPSVTQGDSRAAFLRAVEELGFPVLIKAAAGGGGKGMQIVETREALEGAVDLARAEAVRAFGNDEVYAERYLASARHIEVQIMADHHGHVLHLGERDCSIQRRFQKIIEESPAPGLSDETRTAMAEAAVALARQERYRGAGTVEFVLDADSEDFYF
ncbi:MAG: ATP-grasp domain-containing protein, partial [Desulfobacterales bacterium]|nr:ATP-grasp domain-containing protein [Desulfobacterales bacterium]